MATKKPSARVSTVASPEKGNGDAHGRSMKKVKTRDASTQPVVDTVMENLVVGDSADGSNSGTGKGSSSYKEILLNHVEEAEFLSGDEFQYGEFDEEDDETTKNLGNGTVIEGDEGFDPCPEI